MHSNVKNGIHNCINGIAEHFDLLVSASVDMFKDVNKFDDMAHHARSIKTYIDIMLCDLDRIHGARFVSIFAPEDGENLK